MIPDMELGGRVAVVTGAAGRLGRYVVEEFVRRGVRVAALVSTSSDRRGIDRPGRITGFPCDLRVENSVVATFERVRDEIGPIALCVHTVGAWGARPFLETSLFDWTKLLDTNLSTAFLCLREATRHMVAEGSGGIVAIASRQGADGSPPGQAAYAASKAGLIRLVEAIAAEHGPHGITARIVAPSTILFDGDDGPGIPVADLAAMCVDLASPGCAESNGSITRAYGTAL